MFTLKIDTNGAAFHDEDGGLFDVIAMKEEIERILKRIPFQILCGQDEGKCIDINGNVCGEWRLTDNE